MDTIEDVTARIAKLLKLAERSSSPEEAATAAAKAADLMTRYEIERDSVETTVPTAEEPIESTDDAPLDQMKKYMIGWKLRLADIVARHRKCKMTYVRCLGEINLIGRRNEIQTVRYLYAYLVSEIERITKERASGRGKAYANSFRLGMVDTIRDTLEISEYALIREMKREAEASVNSDRALVRVNAALEKREKEKEVVDEWANSHYVIRTVKARDPRVEPNAYHAGVAAGSAVVVTKARGSLGEG